MYNMHYINTVWLTKIDEQSVLTSQIPYISLRVTTTTTEQTVQTEDICWTTPNNYETNE